MSLRLLPPVTPKPFEISGPLPAGFTVLEASAGTGKTYSLAGLVARFVAEDGLDPSQLCVVSFTEAATAELRGRIRSAPGRHPRPPRPRGPRRRRGR